MDVEPSELEAALHGVFWFLMQVIAPGESGIDAYLKKNREQFTLADLSRYGYGAVWSGVTSKVAPSGEADPAGPEEAEDAD